MNPPPTHAGPLGLPTNCNYQRRESQRRRRSQKHLLMANYHWKAVAVPTSTPPRSLSKPFFSHQLVHDESVRQSKRASAREPDPSRTETQSKQSMARAIISYRKPLLPRTKLSVSNRMSCAIPGPDLKCEPRHTIIRHISVRKLPFCLY